MISNQIRIWAAVLKDKVSVIEFCNDTLWWCWGLESGLKLDEWAKEIQASPSMHQKWGQQFHLFTALKVKFWII